MYCYINALLSILNLLFYIFAYKIMQRSLIIAERIFREFCYFTLILELRMKFSIGSNIYWFIYLRELNSRYINGISVVFQPRMGSILIPSPYNQKFILIIKTKQILRQNDF